MPGNGKKKRGGSVPSLFGFFGHIDLDVLHDVVRLAVQQAADRVHGVRGDGITGPQPGYDSV